MPSQTFRTIVERYHGPEGDAFARHELTPVAARFLRPGAKALEVLRVDKRACPAP